MGSKPPKNVDFEPFFRGDAGKTGCASPKIHEFQVAYDILQLFRGSSLKLGGKCLIVPTLLIWIWMWMCGAHLYEVILRVIVGIYMK